MFYTHTDTHTESNCCSITVLDKWMKNLCFHHKFVTGVVYPSRIMAAVI